MTAEFWFCLDNFIILNLPIVKVKKVNIADTYLQVPQWKACRRACNCYAFILHEWSEGSKYSELKKVMLFLH